jgi:pimeloyl-ACP methyl ester carboxylesterase
MSFVDANGLRFGYLEWGSGPLVLMFHGFPDTAHTWDALGPALASAGFRAVAPFMRGYAPTAVPDGDADTRVLGQDVLALISALGADKACVVGHDWGAEAVFAAAGLGPERVEKLVTVAIPARPAIPWSPTLAWDARHFITLRLPGAVSRFMADDFAMVDVLCRRWSPTWKFGPEELAPVKKALAERANANAALGYYRATQVLTPEFLRRPVSMPSLAVCGADDPALSPADFEAARRCYASTYQVVSVPGGHFCHRESPDAFVKAVVGFLKGT